LRNRYLHIHPNDEWRIQPNLAGDVTGTREKKVITREKTREKILLLMKVSPKITTSQMAKKLGISPKGVEWQISKLKADGSIRRIGPDNGGHWEVMM
jgi:ATP-dependent DNA helicase RecG